MVDGLGTADFSTLTQRTTSTASHDVPCSAEGSLTSAYLLRVINQVADSVRSGDYTTSRGEGVLLDTAVGAIRCLLITHDLKLSPRLSPREEQIAVMVASGGTNQSIAIALDISVWTVSTHLRRIFAKLDVGSRAEMVAHLLGQGARVSSSWNQENAAASVLRY